MSMTLCITTVADTTIDRILEKPVLAWQVIAPGNPDIHVTVPESKPKPKRSLLARLLGKKEEVKPPEPPEEIPPLTLGDGEGVELDIDKAWHGLHYLFTGTDYEGDPPLNFIALGGIDVGDDIDFGYGPARAFRSSEVTAIHQALQELGEDELRSRYDPNAMEEAAIYPNIWDRDPEEDDVLGYLVEHYAALREFMQDTTSKGLGVLVMLG